MLAKTYSPKPTDVKREWHFVDADGQVLGRLAANIAKVLAGKNKAVYTTTMNMGDKVVVTNAKKIVVTGGKEDKKKYYWHTGFPGGIKEQTLRDKMNTKPTDALRLAVKGMLPKNKLLKERMKNLYIYAGEEHPHKGQE